MKHYIEEIESIFRTIEDRRVAHSSAQRVLSQMARDPNSLKSIFKANLLKEGFLDKVRHHPIIGLPVTENEDFQIVAHLWFPLPKGQPSVSHQSIHHHGSLLLTSVSAYGEGYESILFKDDWKVNPENNEAHLNVNKFYKNPLYGAEFVDSNTPHVVFFPEKLSVTYALWSKDKRCVAERVKSNPLIQVFKEPIKLVLNGLGLSRFFGINKVENFDFCLDKGRVILMKDRVFGYTEGTNENFLKNIFHVMQEFHFEDADVIEFIEAHFKKTENRIGLKILEDFRNCVPIPYEFFEDHIQADERVNIGKDELLKVFHLEELSAA